MKIRRFLVRLFGVESYNQAVLDSFYEDLGKMGRRIIGIEDIIDNIVGMVEVLRYDLEDHAGMNKKNKRRKK